MGSQLSTERAIPYREAIADDIFKKGICGLTKKEEKHIRDVARSCGVGIEEAEALYLQFRSIATEESPFNCKLFCNLFEMSEESSLARRIFQLWDTNHDQIIEYAEYVRAFRALSDPKEKLEFSFKVFDLDGDGFISKEELTSMLRCAMKDRGVFVLSDEQVEGLVKQTFEEVDINHDGKISLEEYRRMCVNHPNYLQNVRFRSLLF
eukprot:TRINITY_DN3570_c0_g1_i1.p1 TRINITY_DN3570_c0_g1~~TRINITY_DN3570_c0_g1_i1.p1  ORF type:complete len:207 (-),score=36.64 TRINITY_DN3570_c0_g1_i1:9-629(-)